MYASYMVVTEIAIQQQQRSIYNNVDEWKYEFSVRTRTAVVACGCLLPPPLRCFSLLLLIYPFVVVVPLLYFSSFPRFVRCASLTAVYHVRIHQVWLCMAERRYHVLFFDVSVL